MMWSLAALVIGFCIDLLVGDPHSFPHPVVLIGKCISVLERVLRCVCPKTPSGERAAGAILWGAVVIISTAVPALLLWLCGLVSPWLRLALESVMCWQILAVKSLRDETMKVYDALESGDLAASRRAVSMIVGRDTDRLDDAAVTRAAVETVAENTSDGVVAPLLFLAIGGAPLGFFYKAVNTMDSMLGYVEPPYKDIGLVPAKADDIANYLPARISALLMLAAGGLLRMDVKNGWKIFRRDRYKHASPNSAQTESVCAGLLDVRLAGDAWYHGVLHKKEYIGDALRQIEHEDIPRACRLMYGTTLLALLLGCAVRLLIFSAFISFSFGMSGHKQRILHRITVICLTYSISGKSHTFIETDCSLISHTYFQMDCRNLPLCCKADQALHQKSANSFFLSVPAHSHIGNISLIQNHKKTAVTQNLFFLFHHQKHGIIPGQKGKKTFFCPWHMKKILLNLHYLIQVIHKHFPQDHIFVPAGFCSFSLSARSRSAWETRRYSGICSIAVSVRPSL